MLGDTRFNTNNTACATTTNSCSVPTIQAGNISFPLVGTNSMSINWTNGSGTGRMVVAKAGSFVNGTPTNGTTYAASTIFGNGSTIATGEYVVYNGSGSGPINITNLSPNTNYYFRVFEYNCTGSNIVYKSSNYTLNPNNQTTNGSTNNLNCTNAINIGCGQSLSGTTVGANSNVSLYSCTTWEESGSEKVYKITTTGTNDITATLTNMSNDLDVFILSNCSSNSCLANGDVTATYNNAPQGTYYIIVDGFSGNSGSYTLTLNCTPSCAIQPNSCSTSIGTPANGIEHHTNLSCTPVNGVDSYNFEWSPNGITWYLLVNTSNNNWDVNNSDNPNSPLYYRVSTVCGNNYSALLNASPQPIYTACDEPATPTVNNPTSNSLNITLNTELPIANPSYTTYAIYCTTTNQYVQSNGTLSSSPYYQTKANWGIKTVTGLTINTTYCFYAIAKNMLGDTRFNTSNSSCETTSNITGVINSNFTNNFNIYPNPNNGEFTLEVDLQKSGNCEIRITNMLGQIIYEETKFITNTKNKIPIQLSNIVSGAYNVNLIIDKENYSKQIIITK